MDELKTHANPTFEPFNIEDDGYSSSDFSLASTKGSLSTNADVESSNTVIMLVLVTAATNLKEQLASMKDILDKLSKESVEKNAQIKCQND